MNILVFTNLFPNPSAVSNGIFVKNRVSQYPALGHHVLALVPIPWFPFRGLFKQQFSFRGLTFLTRKNDSFSTCYFKYFHIPLFGMLFQPDFMARAAVRALQHLPKRFSADVIDTHYLYPDGVAAAHLAKHLKVPLVLSARGSDVNRIMNMRLVKPRMQDALNTADKIITVSNALKQAIAAVGVEQRKIVTIPNGVDSTLFCPAIKDLGKDNKNIRLLMIGHIDKNKGQHLLLETLRNTEALFPNRQVECTLVGRGDGLLDLKKSCKQLPLSVTVRFVDPVPQAKLAAYYRNTDFYLLLSRSEGCPNVVFESMATGKPVLATAVGDIKNVITDGVNGLLISERTSRGIAAAINKALTITWSPQSIRNTVLDKSWEDAARTCLDVLGKAVERPLRVLTYTTLFPNNVSGNLAIFVKERMKRVSKLCALKVIAPVPYFPPLKIFPKWHRYSKIVSNETIDGLEVTHPRYFITPLILMSLYGRFIYHSTIGSLLKLHRSFKFDIIDAHYIYPDGLAAIMAGRKLNVPVVISARGTDINYYPQLPSIRPLIKSVLEKSDHLIAVCQALKDEMVALGAPPDKVTVIPNGVDTNEFYPIDTLAARAQNKLPLNRPIIGSVGNLNERKGFHFTLEAIALLKQRRKNAPLLVIVGEGEYRSRLDRLVENLGLQDDVIFTGAFPHNQLAFWYSSFDVFCLASSREGWANVLFEAMACAKPVVATRIWGTPEVVCSGRYGYLVEDQKPSNIADALDRALETQWDHAAIVAYAQTHTWDNVAESVHEVLKTTLERYKHS